MLLILCSSVSLDVFFFAGGVGYYSMWFLCSIYPRTINACWLFGPQRSHAYVLWRTTPWVSQFCMCTSLHVFTQTAHICGCAVLCHFSDVYVNLRAYSCSRECVRCWSGRVCSLFMDCKEVLSVSVRAAEWLELVKPFSSPWSNPGDCCVDATLTAITDKFKRL